MGQDTRAADVVHLISDDAAWPLEVGRTYRLGRDPHCDICIPHQEVSRAHAEVFYDSTSGWSIRDGRSLNGVYVDGRKVSQASLDGGAGVALGPSPEARCVGLVSMACRCLT